MYLHVIVCIYRKRNIQEIVAGKYFSFKAQCPLLNVLACGALAFHTAF